MFCNYNNYKPKMYTVEKIETPMVTNLKINKITPFSTMSAANHCCQCIPTNVQLNVKMSVFEDQIKELIVLSNLIRNEGFRVSFINHFTSKVRELEDMSSEIDEKILQRLQFRLIETLIFQLRKTSNSEYKCVLIESIIRVLKITPVSSVNEFFEVYTVIFFQIFKISNLPYTPSEELKECVLECCSLLIKNSTPKVLEEVYSEEYGAKFSLGISISVNIMKEDRSVKLRIAALDFLLTASKFENQSMYSEDIYHKVGDLFMFYLPGVLAPLTEIVLRNETQHHLITMKALTCWGHVLCLVMKDSAEDKILSDEEIILQWKTRQYSSSNEIIDVNEGLKQRRRTQLWLNSAAITLHPLVLRIADLRKHTHPKCRLELTLLMVKLLKNCTRNLQNCLSVVIEVLVTSAADEDSDVKKVAEKALSELESECDIKNISAFVPIIEGNLYSTINNLPGVLQSGNEKTLLLLLKSFSGYLRILGRQNRLQPLFSLSSTLKKLISAFKICFELEIYPEISTQNVSVWDDEIDSDFWYKPWKRFRYFSEESIIIQLEEICRDLGHFGHPETLFDFLLDTFHEQYSSRKEILLILNEVILGANKMENHTIGRLLDFYLAPENLFLPLEVVNSDCSNFKEIQTNIIKVALVMEGIGKLAKQIGKKFEEYLLKTLYYVLQRMGSSFLIIKEAASKSAIEIANACGLKGSVKSLIQSNIDYLSYHLTVNLKRSNNSVFDVVAVIIKNSPFQAVPSIEEIINSVLKSSSQNFDSPCTLSYLRLLQVFVVRVTEWMNAGADLPSSTAQTENLDLNRLLKYLQKEKLMNYDKEEETKETEEIQETFDGEKIPEESEKSRLPRHLKLTLAVANHCLHYLASNDKYKKIIVLEILNECVLALAKWEDDLLPLVHNIWSPLTTKLESITDALIISRTFKLICTLSFISKDFVRARTLKNVLPTLEYFLIKQAAKSRLKDSTTGYFFTQNFKLQRQLLHNIGKIASNLKLFEKQTDLLVESAMPYLSDLQPRALQEGCRIFFEDIIPYDKQLVWFKLQNKCENPEFAKNCQLVLNLIK